MTFHKVGITNPILWVIAFARACRQSQCFTAFPPLPVFMASGDCYGTNGFSGREAEGACLDLHLRFRLPKAADEV